MKKLLSFLLIFLLISNMFVFEVFASTQIDLSIYSIKRNGWDAHNIDIEVYPWDTLSFLISWKNRWDTITNVEWNFTFSSNNFSYINKETVDFYKNWYVETENIPTSLFNPPIDNIIPMTSEAIANDILDLYYFDLVINQDVSDNVITTSAKITSLEWNSNTLSRNIFINSNPHIVDYYFEKAWSKITQFSRWGEQIDFLIKVKDYNWCENIDNWTVSANLSSLWLWSNELLSFLSCDTWTKTAIFKKSAISTLVFPTTLSFDYSNFSATDESWNVNKPNDSQTSFDNEDKKDSISLVISSAWTPDLSYTIDDDYIWSSSNNISVLSYIWNQNWDLKISLWSDSSCNWWTTLYDWTNYLANTNINSNINASDLSEWINNIFLCLKNDENIIWTTNLNITKDITSPLISSVRVTPVNIVLEDSLASFICSEGWNFRIEKWGNWILDSWTILSSWSVTSLIEQSQIVSNSDLWLNDNTIYIYCIDEAWNSVSQEMTINKTTPPPSFAAENVSFLDNDIDYDWLDWRDIYFSWDNNLGLNYDYFGSYVLYVLPDNIPFDTVTQQNISIITDASINSFTWTTLITKDSLGNDFVSESNYKMCILINWTNWLLWTEKCSSSTVLTSDDASHANILSAKFTSDTNLEITTDVVLDSNKSVHKPDFISFDFNWSTVTWKTVSSIDSKKINIEIDSLSSISAVWTNLIVLTWALRASTGWFNDLINFSNITDWQTPIISTPINNTSSIYNNFFNWIINLAYAFQEEMLTSFTKFEITRIWWNLDSNIYYSQITWPNLYTWNHNSDIDLSSLNLIDWVYYQIKLLWKDLAWNYNTSGVLSNIKYDSVWPDIIIQNITSLYSTLTPELSWNIPLDNNWNGSWIKEYKLDVFNWNDCTWDINNSYTVNTNSKVIDAVINIADYSWEVVAIDNIWNTWIKSICSNFRVDTSVPVFSDFEIKDTILNSSIYISNTNPIEIKSTITDTDKDHIWLDISMITWNTDNNYESCANPSAWITCDYVWNVVTYNFNAWNSLVDWTKQVIFNAQNTSWWNDVQQIISTTSDSNSPTIDLWAFISPTWIVWWTWTTVTWDNSKIYDTIWLDYLQVEYSTWAWTWNMIWTWSNIWYMDWNLIDVASWVDYKIKITAFDKAWNNSETISSIFEVDRTNPVVPDDTITYPVWWEILGWLWTIVITWDNSLITDNILAVNPISLFYSIDGWSSWNLIWENLANNWSYSWTHWNLNSQDVLLKITAFDSVWNFESSEINNTFTIDTISPVLNFDFSSTPVNWKYINNSWFDVLWSNFDIHDLSTSYSLIDLTSWEYFNWTSFTWTTEIFNQICLDTQSIWSNENCNLISFTLVQWIIDSHNYRFKLKSIDEAWNETFSIPLDYIWDTINPNISILTSSWTYFKDSILIEWNSSDLWSWISSVKIQIKKWNDYWDGNDFVNSIQTLNTNSVNNFSTWSYNFNYNWDDWEYLVTSIAYDKSFKVNNISEQSIIVNKDTTAPEITWGANIFTSPLLNDIS